MGEIHTSVLLSRSLNFMLGVLYFFFYHATLFCKVKFIYRLDRDVRRQWYIYNSQLNKDATDTGISYP